MTSGVYYRDYDKIYTAERGRRISEAKKGMTQQPQCGFKKGHTGYSTEKSRKKMSESSWIKGKFGKDNPNWKGGSQKNERNDPAYHQWVRKVKSRDKQTCRICDENCDGYNIVHHIFSWVKYIKLRYELTNGITLCQAHHPRGRVKEELFRKLFSYLVIQK